MNVHDAIKHIENGDVVNTFNRGIKRMIYKKGDVYYAESPSGFVGTTEISIALGVVIYGKRQRVDIGKIRHDFELMT